MGSDQDFNIFIKNTDPTKHLVLKHYRQLSRDLNRAYLKKKQNDVTFDNVHDRLIPEKHRIARHKNEMVVEQLTELLKKVHQRRSFEYVARPNLKNSMQMIRTSFDNKDLINFTE